MKLKYLNGDICAEGSASGHSLDTEALTVVHLFHGGKTTLKNLDGQGAGNRFLYTTSNVEMAKLYGEVITPIYLVKDAKVEDLSDPEVLYGDVAALTAIADYVEQNNFDPDALLESVSNGRVWEGYGQYVQDDLHDVIGPALNADLLSLPDSTFGSSPEVQGKTFVVLNMEKITLERNGVAR